MHLAWRAKSALPWWMKIVAKIIMSRIPATYSMWQKLQLFRHGHMDSIEYALGIFISHLDRTGLRGGIRGKTVLELGPGDSVATALIAKAQGAKSILVDAGQFASMDLSLYKRLADALRSSGHEVPEEIDTTRTFDELLAVCECSYLTDGLESLKRLPDSSVDLVFSQAVLEHVRMNDFLETQLQIRRILRPHGLCSHRIDLRDHLGGGLNNLRFKNKMWESEFFARSGFYTNRIQMNSMLDMFRAAAFKVEARNVERWRELPLPRKKMAPPFCWMSENELNISGFDVVLHAIVPIDADKVS